MEVEGLALAAIGVVLFSFSLPATKLAVEGLDPWFVSFGRAAVAAVLSVAVLRATHAPRPTRAQWRKLAIVAFGIVLVFPALTSLALRHVDSAHGAVLIALLPAGTAAWAVVRAGERPSLRFWAAALAGVAAVVAFIFAEGVGGAGVADVELLVATVLCSLGYAEGGALSRELGGPQTVCWALVLVAPLTFVVALVTAPYSGHVGTDAWVGFAYVSAVSMFLGFFFWYAGLARGGVAKAGQVQLLQPLLTLVCAGLILGEHVSPLTIVCAVAVLASVAATQRARVDRL
ncbi:MAG: family transporter [Solirubrobacteraceae bacterium]|nr:family transporter [Solirubrobacteraceae bacterium]